MKDDVRLLPSGAPGGLCGGDAGEFTAAGQGQAALIPGCQEPGQGLKRRQRGAQSVSPTWGRVLPGFQGFRQIEDGPSFT